MIGPACGPDRFDSGVQQAKSDSPVNVGPQVFERASIPTDPTRFSYNHVASIVEAPSGDLLVAWGAGTAELADDTVILLSRRARGGNAWTEPSVIADKPGHADANPTLFVDDQGRLCLYYVEMFGSTFCTGRVMVRTSTDAGATWSEPRDALGVICTMVRNHPIITRSGRWILPAYQQAAYASQFWISDDRGESWRAASPLFTPWEPNLQPAVVEISDGSLLSLMRCAGDSRATWEGRSTDGGQTWTMAPRPALPNPNSGLELIRLAGGDLLLVYNNSRTERTPLVAALSTDEGRTWAPPRVIAEGEPQLSYPSACQTRDGRIHIVYSDRLAHITHVEFDRAWLSSR